MSLPYRTSSEGDSFPCCPWCRQLGIEDATVRLGDLIEAWDNGDTDWPTRTPEGKAGTALIADCPNCTRPFMIALGGATASAVGREVRLVPVRTETDLRFLGVAS